MIVTDSAKQRIKIIEATTNQRVRLLIDSGGCSGYHYHFDLDEQHDDDVIIDRILVDPCSLSFLSNAKVDFRNGFSGQYFDVDIPEAVSECGCGKSFSIHR